MQSCIMLHVCSMPDTMLVLQPKGKDEDKKQDGEKMGSGRAIPIKQVSY